MSIAKYLSLLYLVVIFFSISDRAYSVTYLVGPGRQYEKPSQVMDLVSDGDTVLIGAPADDDAGSQSGSAYAFVRSPAAAALLRTAANALNPVTPPLRDLLPLELPRDLYIPDFVSGELDPEPGVLPLLFYGLDRDATVGLVKVMGGDIQITY